MYAQNKLLFHLLAVIIASCLYNHYTLPMLCGIGKGKIDNVCTDIAKNLYGYVDFGEFREIFLDDSLATL